MQSNSIQKPKNLSHHDYLVRKVAVRVMKGEEIVAKVISHSFKEAHAALKVHSEVEISGFGKFYISQVKLKNRIATCQTIITRLLAKHEDHLAKGMGEEAELDLKKLESTKATLKYYLERLKP